MQRTFSSNRSNSSRTPNRARPLMSGAYGSIRTLVGSHLWAAFPSQEHNNLCDCEYRNEAEPCAQQPRSSPTNNLIMPGMLLQKGARLVLTGANFPATLATQ